MAAPAPTIFTDLLAAVVERLKGAPEFIAPDVDVITDREEGLAKRITDSLSKNLGSRGGGLCVIVGLTARLGEGRILVCRVVCDVWENTLVNRTASGTKIPGVDAGFVVLQRLAEWAPEFWGAFKEPERGDQLRQISNSNGLIAYQAVFETACQLDSPEASGS